jgi:hypothetical protein
MVKPNPALKMLLQHFAAELRRKVELNEAGSSRKVTKGHALINGMINDALGGDQRMMAHVLKLFDKLDTLPSAEALPAPPQQDWIGIFTFYAKYKLLIEQEIERLKVSNPSYWGFEWFCPTLETAPWYNDLYPLEK